ncbi:MAG TPA: ATP-binding protein [Vicinamibacteria bacterium]|nr:ATP-binding protein [Vicinamibacteria bacterium]
MSRLSPLSLRDRFILSSTALITLLMSVVIFFVEKEQTAVLEKRAAEHGVAVARAVAQLSENRLMYYDLVALQQNMEYAAEDEDVLFAIIFNRNARTLAANEEARELFPPELFEMGAEMGRLERGKVLKGELTFDTNDGRTMDVLEVVVPVFVEDELWGAVKLGLSLSNVNAEIRRIRIGLISLGFLGLTFGALGSVFLANRISRPLESLVEGTIRVARGDLSHRIDVASGDEIGELASNFNRMTAEILDDRQKLEEASRKLMEAEKLATIGRLATALAHEIRNPLTAVKLNIQKIARHPALGSMELEQLGIAESGIQQVEKLVKDILSYARAPKLAKASFQLETLLEEALRFVEEPIEEKEIRVVASFEELAPMVVDGDQLRQAFLNILLNATEAVGHGGTIAVETRLRSTPEGSVAEISIGDDGVGIEETDRESIFDAFFTTKSLGTGLGLTNARKVVELHRGAIEVVSEVGRGTRVTVLLPYEGAAPSSETQETIASTP